MAVGDVEIKGESAWPERIICSHCEAKGFCHSSKEGSSCLVCKTKAAVKELNDLHFGLVCSVCKGHGSIEPFSERLRDRTGPILAFVLCYLTLAILVYAMRINMAEKILPFAATVIGSITGFYFGSRSSH